MRNLNRRAASDIRYAKFYRVFHKSMHSKTDRQTHAQKLPLLSQCYHRYQFLSSPIKFSIHAGNFMPTDSLSSTKASKAKLLTPIRLVATKTSHEWELESKISRWQSEKSATKPLNPNSFIFLNESKRQLHNTYNNQMKSWLQPAFEKPDTSPAELEIT